MACHPLDGVASALLLAVPERAEASALGLARVVDQHLACRRRELGEQSLVFINRRGYAPVLACEACGWTAVCTRCTARMVLHSVDAVPFGKPEVIVNMAANKFADGVLKDQGAQDLIKQQLAAFAKYIERHKV